MVLVRAPGQGRVEGRVRRVDGAGGEVGPLGVPEVLFLIGACEGAGGGGDPVGDVADFSPLVVFGGGGRGGGRVDFADCAGDDIDVEVAG